MDQEFLQTSFLSHTFAQSRKFYFKNQLYFEINNTKKSIFIQLFIRIF